MRAISVTAAAGSQIHSSSLWTTDTHRGRPLRFRAVKKPPPIGETPIGRQSKK
jgi:hypothetical protein